MNGNLKAFERGVLPLEREAFIAKARRAGLSAESAMEQLERLARNEVWINGEYQVNIDKAPEHGFEGMIIWHLSIKRMDKRPIHDWRDLQEIKNRMVGHDCEAIELYPASGRVVDTANQYHLWAFVVGSDGSRPRLPIGWAVGVQLSSKPENGGQRRPHA